MLFDEDRHRQHRGDIAEVGAHRVQHRAARWIAIDHRLRSLRPVPTGVHAPWTAKISVTEPSPTSPSDVKTIISIDPADISDAATRAEVEKAQQLMPAEWRPNAGSSSSDVSGPG